MLLNEAVTGISAARAEGRDTLAEFNHKVRPLLLPGARLTVQLPGCAPAFPCYLKLPDGVD